MRGILGGIIGALLFYIAIDKELIKVEDNSLILFDKLEIIAKLR